MMTTAPDYKQGTKVVSFWMICMKLFGFLGNGYKIENEYGYLEIFNKENT